MVASRPESGRRSHGTEFDSLVFRPSRPGPLRTRLTRIMRRHPHRNHRVLGRRQPDPQMPNPRVRPPPPLPPPTGASTSSPRLDQTDTETCHTGAPSLSRAQRSTARIVRTRSPVACRLSRVYGRSARGSLSARAHHSPLSGFHVPGSVHMNPPALPADFRTRPHTAGSRHTPRRRCRSNPDKLENVAWQPAQWHAPARVHRAPHEWVMTTVTAPARCSRPPPPGYP